MRAINRNYVLMIWFFAICILYIGSFLLFLNIERFVGIPIELPLTDSEYFYVISRKPFYYFYYPLFEISSLITGNKYIPV